MERIESMKLHLRYYVEMFIYCYWEILFCSLYILIEHCKYINNKKRDVKC